MTLEIAAVLFILISSVVLFITEWIRMDLVALLVLSALAVSGLVPPEDALAGFSNPAVIAVWAMFILSAGLTETGVSGWIGRQVFRMVGSGEIRIILVLMLTAGVLSAFMNNVAVAAFMLPVTMDIARKSGRAPSRLLMPVAFACLLGGLTTLVGTPPNLLISNALVQRGLNRFELFDFSPVGGLVMIGGMLFVALLGRHLLPRRDPATESASNGTDLQSQYALQERTFVLVIPDGSSLAGRSLAASCLGSALDMNVLGIFRGAQTIPAPRPGEHLQANDRLLVQGRLGQLEDLRAWSALEIDERRVSPEQIESDEVRLAELRVAPGSPLCGRRRHESGLRSRLNLNLIAVVRPSEPGRISGRDWRFAPGDLLLVQARRDALDALEPGSDFDAVRPIAADELESLFRHDYGLEQRVFSVHIPAKSVLSGKTLAESRLGDALGLNVIGIQRGAATLLMLEPDQEIRADDHLVVEGWKENLAVLHGLQGLEVETATPDQIQTIESDRVGLLEATLAPRSSLAGSTPRELQFRDRYGLQIVSLWREGEVRQGNLRDLKLAPGDAFLLQGPRERLSRLAQDRDFLVLTEALKAPPSMARAPLAAAILLLVVLPVMLGLLPISVSAVAGAAVMVLTRCLSMEQAHRAIDWRSIFLIAGMLPLGVALDRTGAASLLAGQVSDIVGPFGPWPVIFSFYLLTALATAIIPTAALVVLMAPIVLQTAEELHFSPYTAMMAVAIAASASFTSPISHPANVMVMGPGGYRFVDYVKLGIPLTIVVMLVAFLALPLTWPLTVPS